MTEKARHQADVIGAALVRGEVLTSVEASNRYRVWRLSSIIHRLRWRGWPIIAERDHQNGLAHYRVPAGWSPNNNSIVSRQHHD